MISTSSCRQSSTTVNDIFAMFTQSVTFFLSLRLSGATWQRCFLGPSLIPLCASVRS